MAAKKFARLVVDQENNAETWWDEVRSRINVPAEIRTLLGGKTEVMVAHDRVAAVVAWCKSLPGWDDGPEYARNPLVINMTEKKFVRLVVNHVIQGQQDETKSWMFFAARKRNKPAEIRNLLNQSSVGLQSVLVPLSRLDAILAWCAKIPGWEPNYPSTPILVRNPHIFKVGQRVEAVEELCWFTGGVTPEGSIGTVTDVDGETVHVTFDKDRDDEVSSEFGLDSDNDFDLEHIRPLTAATQAERLRDEIAKAEKSLADAKRKLRRLEADARRGK